MKEILKKLVNEIEATDPQNEVLWEVNRNSRLKIMLEDLDATIKYLNECSENELYWATDLLEELSAHFKSPELITCIEKNIKRCKNKKTIDFLKQEIEFMKSYLN